MTTYVEMNETFEQWTAGMRIINHRSKKWPKYLLDIYRADVQMSPEERMQSRSNAFVSARNLYIHGTDADRKLIKDNWERMHTWVKWESVPHNTANVQP